MANAYFDQLCDLRRREPQDDLTTELVRAEEAGDRLTTEELHANIGLLFGAGHETTTNLIGNGLLALHRAPDQWQRLKDDPSLIPGAVEELLRYDSSVQMTGRVTKTEVEVGGVTLPAGESVIMLLGAANRDPAQYADPETLDVGRQNIRPMSFGGGIHHCLGAQLARLEAELVFTALVERLPILELPEKDAPDLARHLHPARPAQASGHLALDMAGRWRGEGAQHQGARPYQEDSWALKPLADGSRARGAGRRHGRPCRRRDRLEARRRCRSSRRSRRARSLGDAPEAANQAVGAKRRGRPEPRRTWARPSWP